VRRGRVLERLAGGPAGAGGSGGAAPRRWRTTRAGPSWTPDGGDVEDQAWLRERGPRAAREALQRGLLFPAVRVLAAPAVSGADDLQHAPQPAILAPNHSSDLDTPLVLLALPRRWRLRTAVGAAGDRFYRRRSIALATGLWFNTFPFDRQGGRRRGLASAAALLREGWNVLLYPQATRLGGTDALHAGVARLALATGAPIVPVYVGGSALVMPKGRGIDRRGRTRVAFGRPLEPAPDEDPAELTERLATALEQLARCAGGRPAGRARLPVAPR
jgi:1-acyl-sn-glycerol-3-phosphate acyltransferase